MSGVGEISALGWVVFGTGLMLILGIDMLVHRGRRGASRSVAIVWSAVWIAAGLAFALFVAFLMGADAAEEYLAAYLVEKSLSLDNLFIFLVIFRSMQIPEDKHRVVLSFGVFGALAFRAVFILLGAVALEKYAWVTYVFGALLLYTAVRILKEDPSEQRDSRILRLLSAHLPVTRHLHGKEFLVREKGRYFATPLLAALVAIELSDIAFAIDSVPAALAITTNVFVVYSSNAFAILGLRSLYLVLEHALGNLRYLHYGLAAVLAFAGAKITLARWLHVPPLVSVAAIAGCIGVAVAASLASRRS